MADSKLTVSFVTPDGEMSRGDVDMVVVPSATGELGILPDHRSLLAKLAVGKVSLVSGGDSADYAAAGGYVEVAHNHVVIVADAAEAVEDIDVSRAERAATEAETAVAGLGMDDPSYAEQAGRAARGRNRVELGSTAAGR